MSDIVHVVKSGDCLESIAAAHGHHWKTLWELPANEGLRALRKDPNIIWPGDRVVVPAITTANPSAPTDARHRFRLCGVPSILRIRLLRRGEPMVHLKCVLEFTGGSVPGKTDDNGVVELRIPPSLCEATLHAGEWPREREYRLAIGSLDPTDKEEGIRARLNNLGFFAGSVEKGSADELEVALRAFQSESTDPKLDETGLADAETVRAIEERHGC